MGPGASKSASLAQPIPAGHYTSGDIDVHGNGSAPDNLIFQVQNGTVFVKLLNGREPGGTVTTFTAREGETYDLPVDGKWGLSNEVDPKTETLKPGFNGVCDQHLYLYFNGNHVEVRKTKLDRA